jgi:hypothetical protein
MPYVTNKTETAGVVNDCATGVCKGKSHIPIHQLCGLK